MSTSGIPAYEHQITSDDMDFLSSRPLASRDFAGGSPDVSEGQVVEFGENIGYVGFGCDSGYWPPGPECPSDQ